jgi:2-keto-4-pentenoate hydratase/2-oxohepta-3-ene-1,7-dioic acid hydratase in catechol pathway
MKIAAWIVAVAALVLGALAGVSLWVSRPLFDQALDPAILEDITIAPASEALTFARAIVDGSPRLLLVIQYRGNKVTGVDLNARLDTGETDPIALFRRLGYEALEYESASIANLVAVDTSLLDVPFAAHQHNIGIGLNYPEHAREASLKEEPFVFPKLARPTRANSDIARGDSTLLDYEAEVGFVTLDSIAGREPLQSTMGVVLANEMTDRWALVRNFRRGTEMGTTGFADGKSRDGFAPVGNLFVIPRDLEGFYKSVEMRLYLNGHLRQHETAGAMSWGPRQMLGETFRRAGKEFAYRGSIMPLLNSGGTLAAGTIIFSGTPGGVIFRPANLWNPWVYLRPGDEVVIRADYLGVIRNRITE